MRNRNAPISVLLVAAFALLVLAQTANAEGLCVPHSVNWSGIPCSDDIQCASVLCGFPGARCNLTSHTCYMVNPASLLSSIYFGYPICENRSGLVDGDPPDYKNPVDTGYCTGMYDALQYIARDGGTGSVGDPIIRSYFPTVGTGPTNATQCKEGKLEIFCNDIGFPMGCYWINSTGFPFDKCGICYGDPIGDPNSELDENCSVRDMVFSPAYCFSGGTYGDHAWTSCKINALNFNTTACNARQGCVHRNTECSMLGGFCTGGTECCRNGNLPNSPPYSNGNMNLTCLDMFGAGSPVCGWYCAREGEGCDSDYGSYLTTGGRVPCCQQKIVTTVCNGVTNTTSVGLTCNAGVCEGAPLPPNPPPNIPAAPVIQRVANSLPSPPEAGSIYPYGSVKCVANCPPSPFPADPDSCPEPVNVSSMWYADSASSGSWSTENQTQPVPLIFDCPSQASCGIGRNITLHSSSFDPSYAVLPPPSGRRSISNIINVTCVPDGTYCRDQSYGDCCTGNCTAHLCVPQVPPPPPQNYLSYSVAAILIALFFLILAYLATYAFGLAHVRPIIQDEFLQVIITGAVLLGILGVAALADSYVLGAMKEVNPSVTDVGLAARSTLQSRITVMGNAYEQLRGASETIGREASRGIFCSFLGVGFTLVNCSPYNAFRGAITTSAFATSVALADLHAEQFLLSLARNTAFTFLIPLGLFFRCFKISRQAGGALIAIGFGLYAVYPLAIFSTDNLLHGDPKNYDSLAGMPNFNGECDPSEVDSDDAIAPFSTYATSLTNYARSENIAYNTLVRVIFESILNLIITLGFIRVFAHILGSEIDLSALARIS